MRKILSGFAAAMLSFAVPAEEAETLGGTVMPYSLAACGGEPSALAERLRVVSARAGISRFVLFGPGHTVRISGMLDRAGYAAIGEKVRQVKDLVAKDGIDVGYLMLPTMNCGIRHPWRGFIQSSGKERLFTPCPGDPGFKLEFSEKCRLVASAARPFAYVMEDDFRFFGSGCYCEDHLRRFGRKTGRTFTRESLLEALRAATPQAAGLRRDWYELQCGDLRAIASAASAAIREASPTTRIVLCAPGGFPEKETVALARALAGPGRRPAIRWWGAIYGNDVPINAAGTLFFAHWSRENFSPDIECLYESDPVPHSRFYASAARTGAFVSSVMAMGFDHPYHWGLGSGDDALETTPDYLDLHGRERMRYAAIGAAARQSVNIGVGVHFDPSVRRDVPFLASQTCHFSAGAWYSVLNRLGIPATPRGDAPVTLYSGHFAFSACSDDEVRRLLSRPAMLDGAAAEALTRRGLSDLTGVIARGRDKIDFSGERTTGAYGDKTRFRCSFHQNYGLDGCFVSRLDLAGAEALAVYFAAEPDKVVQPSLTRFTNRLGGRVGVMAVDLIGCISPNIYSYKKRDTLVRLFRDLGGERAVPVRVIDRANMSVLAREDDVNGRLMLHLVNYSCDTAMSVTIETMPEYAGAAVELLDGALWRPVQASWSGAHVRIPASAPVYGTVVVRLSRPKTHVDGMSGDLK